MRRIFIALFAGLAAVFTLSACSSQNALGWGTPDDASNNGSYTGYTLNSPTADQNPHPGGDASYPSSVADQGKPLAPPDKADGR